MVDNGDTYGRTVAQVKGYLEDEALREALLFPRAWSAYLDYRRSNDPADIGRRRDERLLEILDHARKQVPYYRRLVSPSLKTSEPLDLLASFPLVDRAELRRNLADHCDDGLDPAVCRSAVTSGTSGVPLRIIHHEDHFVHSWARAMVRNQRMGRALGRRILMPFQKWLDDWFLYSSPGRGLALVGEFGGEVTAESVGAQVEAFGPDTVVGHPSSCLRFAHLTEQLADLRPPIDMVWTFGERLQHGVRVSIEKRLDAPVFDMYGMRECSTIAVQCVSGNYHLEDDRVCVEVVDDDGRALPPDAVGEIVVTNFFSKAMPLIRYRTGDVGSMASEPCGCGDAHRTLRLVEGRNLGVIELPDGTQRDVLSLTRLLRRFPAERFQIVQEQPDSLRILIEPMPGAAISTEDVVSKLRTLLPADDVSLEVERVDADGFVSQGERKATDFVRLVDPESPG